MGVVPNMHIYIYIYVCVCLHICIINMYIYIYIYIHTYPSECEMFTQFQFQGRRGTTHFRRGRRNREVPISVLINIAEANPHTLTYIYSSIHICVHPYNKKPIYSHGAGPHPWCCPPRFDQACSPGDGPGGRTRLHARINFPYCMYLCIYIYEYIDTVIHVYVCVHVHQDIHIHTHLPKNKIKSVLFYGNIFAEMHVYIFMRHFPWV